ncbi:MAG: hypothetical protein ACXWC6_17560 [Ramlibacter sp.]
MSWTKAVIAGACAWSLVQSVGAQDSQVPSPPMPQGVQPPMQVPRGPQPPSPEQMRQVMQGAMQASMSAMVQSMGPMADAVIEAQLNAAARPEAAERLATFKRNLYDALLRKGFTAQQALEIVVATGVPGVATPGLK